MSNAAHNEPILNDISVSLFDPHTVHERQMHDTIIMVLAVVNILTITTTFLVAPAL